MKRWFKWVQLVPTEAVPEERRVDGPVVLVSPFIRGGEKAHEEIGSSAVPILYKPYFQARAHHFCPSEECQGGIWLRQDDLRMLGGWHLEALEWGTAQPTSAGLRTEWTWLGGLIAGCSYCRFIIQEGTLWASDWGNSLLPLCRACAPQNREHSEWGAYWGEFLLDEGYLLVTPKKLSTYSNYTKHTL